MWADEKTGWAEEAYASKLNLPDESFDYDEFVEREFETKKNQSRVGYIGSGGWRRSSCSRVLFWR
jgi:hypothetical protein